MEKFKEKLNNIKNILDKIDQPVFLLINKLDRVPKADKNKFVEQYSNL